MPEASRVSSEKLFIVSAAQPVISIIAFESIADAFLYSYYSSFPIEISFLIN